MGDEGGDSDLSCESVDSVPINIRCANGTTFTVRTTLELTVLAFKGLVAEKCDVPADQQRLIYNGRILQDDQTLETYGLQADHTVHMVRFVSRSSNSPTAPVISAGSGNTTTRSNRGTGSNEADPPLGGFVSPLFPDLAQQHPNQSPNTTTELMNIPDFQNVLNDPAVSAGSGNTTTRSNRGGAFNFVGAGFSDFELAQQHPNQNPNMTMEIMNIPGVQNMVNNPVLIGTYFPSHPRMRNIIDRSPEHARILNDCESHRRIAEAARNAMMRDADRARRNIESSPGWFNRPRLIYENILEPPRHAARLGGNNNSDLNSNPFVSLAGNQGATQPRDASNNPWNAAEVIQPNVGERGTIPTRGLGGLGGLGGPVANESLLSNPEYLNQIRNFNPQVRVIFDTNPRPIAMSGNPEVLHDMISAGTRHQMRNGQQNISRLNELQSTQTSAAPGAATGTRITAARLNMWMNASVGRGAGSLSVPNQPMPPEGRYATQLSQLQQMGFSDTQENIRALCASWGNVHEAIKRLMRNRGR